MRGGPVVAVRRSRGHAERVRDLGGAVRLVVTNQSGEDREAGGIGRRPALGTPVAPAQVEHRAAVRLPPRQRRVPARRAGLVQQPVVAIDDQEMTIAAGAAARNAPFDVVRLRLRFFRNRIAGRTPRRPGIALAAVRRPRRLHERLIAGHDDVRNAVRRRPEIRMDLPRRARTRRGPPADEIDERRRLRIERRGADVLVPPVRRREHLPSGQRPLEHRRRRRKNDGGARQAHDGSDGSQRHVRERSCRVPAELVEPGRTHTNRTQDL